MCCPARSIEFDAGTGTLLVTTTEDGSVRVNGAVRLDSDLTITTSGNAADQIVFTKNAPINSQLTSGGANEENDLVLTAGLGAVRFFANVGGTSPLGSLTITTAGPVQFGDADTVATGDEAAITVVRTTGDINLGSTSPTGLIEFDAGSGRVLS